MSIFPFLPVIIIRRSDWTKHHNDWMFLHMSRSCSFPRMIWFYQPSSCSAPESLLTENINHNPTPQLISVPPEIQHSLTPGVFLSIDMHCSWCLQLLLKTSEAFSRLYIVLADSLWLHTIMVCLCNRDFQSTSWALHRNKAQLSFSYGKNIHLGLSVFSSYKS